MTLLSIKGRLGPGPGLVATEGVKLSSVMVGVLGGVIVDVTGDDRVDVLVGLVGDVTGDVMAMVGINVGTGSVVCMGEPGVEDCTRAGLALGLDGAVDRGAD